MRVRIPSPLHSYTAGESDVVADGPTLGAVLADLDRPMTSVSEVMIVCALSGG